MKLQILTFALLLALPLGLHAQKQMSYQGRLTDSTGAARPGPQTSLTFSLWNQATSGTKVWGDWSRNVDLIDGRFSVKLGDVNGNDGFGRILNTSFGGPRFLEITVGTDPTPLPRQELLASPKAFTANTLSDETGDIAFARDGHLAVPDKTVLGDGLTSTATSSGNILNLLVGNGISDGLVNGIRFSESSSTNGAGMNLGFDSSANALTIYNNLGTARLSVERDSDKTNIMGDLDVSGTITGTINGTINTTNLAVPGTVGIGSTDTPAAKLQVQGGSNASLTSGGYMVVGSTSGTNLVLDRNTLQSRSSGAASALLLNYHGGDLVLGSNTSTTTIRGDDNDGTTAALKIEGGSGALLLDGNEIDTNSANQQLSINKNSTAYTNFGGRVGIGTTVSAPPRAPLDVVLPGPSFAIAGGGGPHPYPGLASWWLAGSGVAPGAWPATANIREIGIRTNEGLESLFVVVHSDERIKTIDGRSDRTQDLETLLGIEITDYGYKDVMTKGNRGEKKVIAQQVEEVFPQAVSRTTDVVPDIYQRAMMKDGWVELATDLKVGERVRLIGEEIDGIHEVLEVAKDRFRTDLATEKNKLFVFGREVDDFRTVDYDAISMLHVSATQELHRQLQAQATELTAQTNEISALEQRLAVLEAKDKKREAKFAKLEQLLTGKLNVTPITVQRTPIR